ncbi:UDP-N-acetylmuramoyl-tripeptide--D-alanyl-D-alanine ligase [Floccifex sp.]|uniref:UDP-N-acetylmuramoyl-tripeptide--D-alanyl-D- alanine ligase n=1 Tax=Floccifex sp. TaxID=2815810 RepID=UPI002A7647B2|nr:UDP-N-acetylmuramoyl-tripeptide--D-alanyl-D-alanine ligase [Floccifex sp.]MDD7282257.1 UDP-N-acetylmuramoyl-tripeptide--D-alanyl-D-alanine ligase [Erysipelotrichaceae bacterium]MDY2958205.1 UDP-N-acetylmuramoyl-tripeptide--D-alanyl-D-alanine ligase [Floccifex sp.]
MIKKTVKEIADLLHTQAFGNIEQDIEGVQTDSRNVTEKTLFIPLIGQRVDGHSFVKDMKCATLWQKDHVPYPEHVPYILVDDTTQALQALAKAYLDTLSCKIIAVTGSNGKTSCKDMLCAIFSQEKKTQKTQGNHNNEIGLPLTILEFDEDIEIGILEMGMENKGEIDFLCSIAQPDYAIITTIGSAHMENLGGKLQIAQAKCEIFENMKDNGTLYYNVQSPEIEEVLKTLSFGNKKAIPFGKGSDICVTSDLIVEGDSMKFTCSILDEQVTVHALGAHQADNALPCIALAKQLGIQDQSILKGLKEMEMTKMRTQLCKVKNCQILDDSYKSNPESCKAAIDTLMSIPSKRHIAVLSDMLDLGPNEQQLHYEIGLYAKEKGIDELICTGPLSKFSAEAYNGQWFETKEECVNILKPYIYQDCAILVKGSRAMAMDKIVSALKEEEVK